MDLSIAITLTVISIPIVSLIVIAIMLSLNKKKSAKRRNNISKTQMIIKNTEKFLLIIFAFYLFAAIFSIGTNFCVPMFLVSFFALSLFAIIYLTNEAIKNKKAAMKRIEDYNAEYENSEDNDYEEDESNEANERLDDRSYRHTNAHIPCLLCGKDAGNKHFCYNCYSKHRDHDIIVKISKCKTATIQEKYAEGQRYTCKDGHIVRSKSELEIDNFLFDNKILHVYEKKLDVNGSSYINPDFYLPATNTYIEHWGLNSEQYNSEKEYKLNIYRNKRLTVICTYEEDITDIEFNLKRKLKNSVRNEINYLK